MINQCKAWKIVLNNCKNKVYNFLKFQMRFLMPSFKKPKKYANDDLQILKPVYEPCLAIKTRMRNQLVRSEWRTSQIGNRICSKKKALS